jgi:eukaryotic-like serine/threonine-protein kinase
MTATLVPGTCLGPYEIESLLGAGGMGEVYRARDSRLLRTVAIKIMHGGTTADETRRARFKDEAYAISSLSHSHIRALYDVGSAGGVDFLVMEYLEGETLASLLRGRPVPFNRALVYAAEIAEALSAAHRVGITHCDIKPANIMVTGSGIKLLDFGVARLWRDLHTPEDLAAAPTDTDDSGGAGTTSYLAPERLEGLPCDRRGDVYAFGVVLYQLFTGRKPFEGRSKSELITAIREHDVRPLSAANADVPPELEHIVHKCLAKDPEWRWQTAVDLATELRWIANRPRPTPRSHRHHSRLVAGGAALLVVSFAIVLWAFATTRAAVQPTRPLPVRFILEPQPGSIIGVNPGAFSVSPDGNRVVFTASAPGGKRVLWVRSMNAYDARPLDGTDDAWNPFWNPDSRRVGFFAGNRVRAVDVGSGTVVTIGTVPPATPRGATATWNATGQILIAANTELLKVAESDGTLTTLLMPGLPPESRVSGVHFLPDGGRFIFHVKPPSSGGMLYLGSLIPGAPARRLGESDSHGVYSEPGYLLYVKGGALMAQAVAPRTLDRIGPAVALLQSVSLFDTFNQAAFSVSSGGVLAYRVGIVTSQLRSFDRSGRLISTLTPHGPYANPALSPDESRIAVTRFDPAADSSDIWIIDARRGMTQLTSASGSEDFPTWSPDGERVLFSSNAKGWTDLFEKSWTAGARDAAEPVLIEPQNKLPFQWGTALRMLLFLGAAPGGFLNAELLMMPAHGHIRAVSLLEDQRSTESGQPQLSPDGRWIAYVADVTGSPAVVVRRLSDATERWLVSTAGGYEPRWRGDGHELFYLAADRTLMAVDVNAQQETLSIGAPHPLFRTTLGGSYLGSPFRGTRTRNEYAVSADGQRFLLNEPVQGASAYSVRVVVNWPALLGAQSD